jgi:hypothetical protein
MVVSLGSAPSAPSVMPASAPSTRAALHRWSKPTAEELNECGTFVSERVHLREIAVIPGTRLSARGERGISPDRLPFADGADISAATPISALQLVDFMISGPVVVQVLEGENAVLKHRDVMGATDPSKAAEGTIRKLHAKSIGENSVHGSDAPETAAIEIAQFFSGNEIVG